MLIRKHDLFISLVLVCSAAHASSATFCDSALKYIAKNPRKAALIAAGSLATLAVGMEVVYEMLPSVKRQRAEEERLNKLKFIDWNIQAFEDIVNAPLDGWIDTVLEQRDSSAIVESLNTSYSNDNPLGRAYNSVKLDLKGLEYAVEKANAAHNALVLFDYEYNPQEEDLNPLEERLAEIKNVCDSKQEKLERCLVLIKEQEGFFEQYKACEAEYSVLLDAYIKETEQAMRKAERTLKQVKTMSVAVTTVGLLAYAAFSFYTCGSCKSQSDEKQ